MTETSHELRVRIRPPRIAVLFSTHTTIDAFLRTIKFLSMVRGGKFARFIFVDMHGDRKDESLQRAKEEVKIFFPELLVVPGKQEEYLALSLTINRPRKAGSNVRDILYSPQLIEITDDFLSNFDESSIGGLTPWDKVVRQEHKKYPNLKRNNLFFLKIDAAEEFRCCVAAAYGLLPDDITNDLAKYLNAEIYEVRVSNAYELYNLFTFMARKLSWLDFLNQGIRQLSSVLFSDPPTVVLLDKQQPIRDLCLFWNLQGHIVQGSSDESLLMLREQDIENQKVLDCLTETFCSSKIMSTYGFIRTAGNNRTALQKAARRLQSRIVLIQKKEYSLDATTNFVAKDISCYEQEKTITVSVENEEVIVPRVDPAYPNPYAFARYYCDLVKEDKTTRYPFDFALPKDSDIFLLLNLPGKHYSYQLIVGFGEEFLSVVFTGSEESAAVRFQLPSEHEIFQVILDRAGCTLRKDEKNIRYSKTLDLFPDFSTACIALTGKCWSIIKALESEPLVYDKLQGKARLGNCKNLEPLPEFAKTILERYPPPFQDIARNRVSDSLKSVLRKESTPDNILEFLTRINVIRRKWLLDKCPSCDREYWQDNIDITSPVMCPGCGKQILITDRVRVGYALNELVRLAVFDEGMRPVVLTARFLRSLTHNGFIWYPGAKVNQGKIDTDFDLLACGDGILIAGECKDFSNQSPKSQSPNWDELMAQVKPPLSIAKECGFKVFFISSFIESYPDNFKKHLQQMAGNSLKILFITKEDLENGYRNLKDEKGCEHRLDIYTLIRPKTADKPKTAKKRRTIDFGWGRISS
uniref:hypothetical protein n=1 Tax=Candidatus Electronema sp. TaxID=2698783 RepID=UPI0040573EE3